MGSTALIVALVLIANNLLIGGAIWLWAYYRNRNVLGDEVKSKESALKRYSQITERNSMLEMQLAAVKKDLIYARQDNDNLRKDINRLQAQVQEYQAAEKEREKAVLAPFSLNSMGPKDVSAVPLEPAIKADEPKGKGLFSNTTTEPPEPAVKADEPKGKGLFSNRTSPR